ncbi:MAG: xanthine/uracil/vitamin C permease [Desulfobacterales bacterium]|nr:xanthine/uracil/vitamin C permease [Desulfobacterales bacterium]MDD4393868.1 xanthine/uracil/vitamin C permease [Desulfobacterales bacterium]
MAVFLTKIRRKYGEETPYIPFGPFKIRIPFIHWGIEMTEILQAMVMFVTGMGAVAVLQDVFGMPFEVALTIVCFHELTYCLHQVFGDPLIPGWISPAVPLMLAFLLKFGVGIDRIHALIAVQLLVGVIFLIMGLTGFAKKLIDIVPKAMQSGIILGAGIAAITGKYGFLPSGTGFYKYPFSITLGGLFAFYLLFSKGFTQKVRSAGIGSKSIFVKIAHYGIVPGIILGIIVGWLTGEIPLPEWQSGLFFIPQVKEVFTTYSIFGAGIPPLDIWMKALPMAIVAYIVAFGDMIVGQTIVMEAQKNFRPDEIVDSNANRLNLMCAIRNFLEGSFAPTVTLAGPLWAAMTVAVAERYKLGRNAMDSIFGGSGSFNFMKFASCLILPLVCIFKPSLPVALSLTLLIQGFACVFIAMNLVDTNAERGVAGITGGALAVAGPTTGLVVGILLSLILLGKGCFGKKKEAPETVASEI